MVVTSSAYTVRSVPLAGSGAGMSDMNKLNRAGDSSPPLGHAPVEGFLLGGGGVVLREGSSSLNVVAQEFDVNGRHCGEVYHFADEFGVVYYIECSAHVYCYQYGSLWGSLLVES